MPAVDELQRLQPFSAKYTTLLGRKALRPYGTAGTLHKFSS